MEAGSVIPHEFHRLWFGPREMPLRYREFGQTWLDHNPGWKLTDHDEVPFEMVNQAAFDATGTTRQPHPGGAKPDSVVAVQRADIASYELLWEHGGVYLNCDMEAVRPLGDLLDGVGCAIAWELDGHYPSNAWMAATPRHPFIAKVLELLPQRLNQFSDHAINEQTGPHLLAQALREYAGGVDDSQGITVTMFPSSMFMPFDFNHLELAAADHPDAYALHHWGHRIPDSELWET